MITLTLKDQPPVPLEAETLCPDAIAGLTSEAVRALPVHLGKRQRRVDDFFTVEGEPGDHLEIRGDVSRVKWIGREMTRGRITIHGDAGMHLGAYMKGGAIDVTGNASDWIGAEMSGGRIRIVRRRNSRKRSDRATERSPAASRRLSDHGDRAAAGVCRGESGQRVTHGD